MAEQENEKCILYPVLVFTMKWLTHQDYSPGGQAIHEVPKLTRRTSFYVVSGIKLWIPWGRPLGKDQGIHEDDWRGSRDKESGETKGVMARQSSATTERPCQLVETSREGVSQGSN